MSTGLLRRAAISADVEASAARWRRIGNARDILYSECRGFSGSSSASYL